MLVRLFFAASLLSTVACGSDCEALQECCRNLAMSPDSCNAQSESACRSALDLLGSACD